MHGQTLIKFTFFLFITHPVVVISYRSSGLMGCPETSVINYHYSLRNYPEERSSLIQIASL